MAVIIAGVFPSRDQAEAAVRELRDRGFDAQDVGLVLRGGVSRAAGAGQTAGTDSFAWVPNHETTSFDGIGNVLVAGQVRDCSVRLGMAQNQRSLTDALTCMGIERDHAEWYDQQVQQGYSLVTVRTENRGSEAQAIMRQFGSIEIPSGQVNQGHWERPPVGGVTPSVPTGRISELSQVQQGYDVYTSDGQYIGTVQEASADCVHVLCCSNMFVPPSRVERVTNDRIVLNVAESDLDNYDWATCHPSHQAEYASGGPGYSGLPPQEHEPGVHIPIEDDDG